MVPGFSGEVEGPELLLRFGGGPLASALSTDAFPPWHLRLTEIQCAALYRGMFFPGLRQTCAVF